MRTALTEADMTAFEPTEKVGLIATIDPEGHPHLTLLSAFQGISPTTMVLGQFSEGESKRNMQENRSIWFLVMTLDKRFWTGSAVWTGLKREGPEYEMFNKKPMFRYNTYFGVTTVHYFDLLEIEGPSPLPMGSIVRGAVLTLLFRGLARRAEAANALNPFSRKLFDALDSLTFLSYLNEKKIPVILPIIQCQSADAGTLAVSTVPYGDRLAAIPPGTEAAVFCMNLSMENVMVRGLWEGIRNFGPVRMGRLAIDYGYNSMPPAHGRIYPPVPLEPVREF